MQANDFKTLKPCENHGVYWCKAKGCRAVDFVSGVDPGDDQDFIDKHKKQWPRYPARPWKQGKENETKG